MKSLALLALVLLISAGSAVADFEDPAVTKWKEQAHQNLAEAAADAKAELRGSLIALRRQGVVQIVFVVTMRIDRRGRIVSSQILNSSGYSEIEHRFVGLVHQTAVLPPMPPELVGEFKPVRFPVRMITPRVVVR